MEIRKDVQNDLFDRKEVKVIVEAEKNPSKQEALKILVDEFKTKQENIKLNSIKGKFGRNTFLIDAYIYSSKETKEKTEGKEEVKEGENQEAPAEQPAPEQKPEEKVEEKPAEEKKEEAEEKKE